MITSTKINEIKDSLINGDEWEITSLYYIKNNDYILFYLDGIYNALDIHTEDEINDIDINRWLNSRYKKIKKLRKRF